MRDEISRVVRPETFQRLCAAFNTASLDGKMRVTAEELCRKLGKGAHGHLDYDEVHAKLRKVLKLSHKDITTDEINAVCEVLDSLGHGLVPMRRFITFTISQKELERRKKK
jgi:hypothetical protein